jgi:hypothetical protein
VGWCFFTLTADTHNQDGRTTFRIFVAFTLSLFCVFVKTFAFLSILVRIFSRKSIIIIFKNVETNIFIETLLSDQVTPPPFGSRTLLRCWRNNARSQNFVDIIKSWLENLIDSKDYFTNNDRFCLVRLR